MMSTYAKQDQISSELAVLHAELRSRQFEPGWNRAGPPPMWSSPRTPFTQAQWRYADARQALMRAEHLVDLEFAERRNLIMVNPTEGNLYPTSRALVLAYQLVLPGERARTHRHTPHAGRLVLEADEGAYTVVNGVQVPMLPGDVLLTPSWSWHGHGNSGTKPAVWIDFLDVPLVHLLDPMFFEPHPDGWAEATIETRDTPILFPYGETNARLDAAEPDPSGCFGRRIELGSPALPTIGLYVHRFSAGTSTAPYRSTANYQYCVIEGSGTTVVDGVEHKWSRGDVIVVPCWSEHSHSASDTATVLAVTDEPLQRYCGYFRTSIDQGSIDQGSIDQGPAALPGNG
jgi:gentisate 1,2-dioxygenase